MKPETFRAKLKERTADAFKIKLGAEENAKFRNGDQYTQKDLRQSSDRLLSALTELKER